MKDDNAMSDVVTTDIEHNETRATDVTLKLICDRLNFILGYQQKNYKFILGYQQKNRTQFCQVQKSLMTDVQEMKINGLP